MSSGLISVREAGEFRICVPQATEKSLFWRFLRIVQDFAGKVSNGFFQLYGYQQPITSQTLIRTEGFSPRRCVFVVLIRVHQNVHKDTLRITS